MRVHWTDNALKHLLDIYEYISQNSPFLKNSGSGLEL